MNEPKNFGEEKLVQKQAEAVIEYLPSMPRGK
jgi:hypothetical protein